MLFLLSTEAQINKYFGYEQGIAPTTVTVGATLVVAPVASIKIPQNLCFSTYSIKDSF